jgi:hypothetical protein
MVRLCVSVYSSIALLQCELEYACGTGGIDFRLLSSLYMCLKDVSDAKDLVDFTRCFLVMLLPTAPPEYFFRR